MRTVVHKAENFTDFSDSVFNKLPQKVFKQLPELSSEELKDLIESKVKHSVPTQTIKNLSDFDEEGNIEQDQLFARNNRFSTKEFVWLVDDILSTWKVVSIEDSQLVELIVSEEANKQLSEVREKCKNIFNI